MAVYAGIFLILPWIQYRLVNVTERTAYLAVYQDLEREPEPSKLVPPRSAKARSCSRITGSLVDGTDLPRLPIRLCAGLEQSPVFNVSSFTLEMELSHFARNSLPPSGAINNFLLIFALSMLF